MQDIDPNDPIFRGITKHELKYMQHFSIEEKEAYSLRLFGESLDAPTDWKKLLEQRWEALQGNTPIDGKPFRMTHERLKRQIVYNERIASRWPTEANFAPAATVSAFANWILRQYVSHKDPQALTTGILGERAVVQHRNAVHIAKREVPQQNYKNWRLIHDGVRQFDGAFEIPTLSVDGVVLSGVPDLVFREKKTGRILIVELKVTSAKLPSDSWPNLRAQLWAYSRIGKWHQAPEVLLAGEIWANNSETPFRRRTYFWRKDDAQLDQECSELFEAYGGLIAASA